MQARSRVGRTFLRFAGAFCACALPIPKEGPLGTISVRFNSSGFMAVNEPSPRAQPEDKVCLRCHKSLATRAITVIYSI